MRPAREKALMYYAFVLAGRMVSFDTPSCLC